MNIDLSVAPEIARLADPLVPAQHATAAPRTDGRIAGDLAELAATPQRWWDLVRFDERGPLCIPLPDAPGTWLLVLPPGTTADCDCLQATALAGEAVELTRAAAGAAGASGIGEVSSATRLPCSELNAAEETRSLRPGRVRVHGTRTPHRMRTVGPGYSVTLHYGAVHRESQWNHRMPMAAKTRM